MALTAVRIPQGRQNVVELTTTKPLTAEPAMVVPGWDDIGRVAAIAVIRTFLTFFLDRDMEKLRERNARGGAHAGST